MAGYKRVNFYELCRLCATNQQKEKTHIFEEEGRKIQLQNKIQSCLSLKVCENDFLPKVVCSQCLRSLEECYSFRSECVNSESMLSSYFNNFRYTEDFKKSGKVYIKDTSPKPAVSSSEIATTLATTSSTTTIPTLNIPNSQPLHKNQDSLYYMQPLATTEKPIKQESNQTKIIQSTALLTQNYNVVNQICPPMKAMTKSEPINSVNNITVNSNGEIINLGSISDIEALIAQNMVQKLKQVNVNKQVLQQPAKRINKVIEKPQENMVLDNSVIHIDLTAAEVNNTNSYDNQKLPHIKATSENKYMYTIKIEDGKPNYNQGIILNQINNLQNQNFNSFQANAITNNNIINTTTPSVNYTPNVTNNVINNIPNMPKVKITSNISLENNHVKIEHQNALPTNVVTSHINDNFLPTDSKQNMLVVSQQNVVNRPAPATSNVIASQTQNSTVAPFLGMSYSAAANGSISVPSTNILPNVSSANIVTTQSNQSQISSDTTSQSLTQNVPNPAPTPQNNQNSSGSSSGGRVHVCDVCQKVFKRREHLNQHLKLHTGFRPFVCESCNKSFMRKEHLLRHMTSHSGQKNFTCNICEKSFSRNDNLLKHKKTHDKQGKYTCEFCQKTFVMKHYYLAHKMTHEPDQKCVWNVLKV